MNVKYMLLWLEGNLQSWGADSKFNRRSTMPFPTRSGILGLVCCALGSGGEQKELLAIFAPLKQLVISYGNAKTPKTQLRDFHMVCSGYDEKDPWETLHIPKTSEGKKAVGGGTKLTHRYYLQDAKFAVVMEIPADMSAELEKAMQHPVWDLYLGRKNCPPKDFIFRGIFKSKDAAIAAADEIAGNKELHEQFRVLDGTVDGGEQITINDMPLQFGKIKKYRDRIITLLKNG